MRRSLFALLGLVIGLCAMAHGGDLLNPGRWIAGLSLIGCILVFFFGEQED